MTFSLLVNARRIFAAHAPTKYAYTSFKKCVREFTDINQGWLLVSELRKSKAYCISGSSTILISKIESDERMKHNDIRVRGAEFILSHRLTFLQRFNLTPLQEPWVSHG